MYSQAPIQVISDGQSRPMEIQIFSDEMASSVATTTHCKNGKLKMVMKRKF